MQIHEKVMADLDAVETKVGGWTPASATFCTKKGVTISAFLIVGESEILLNRREIEELAASFRKWLDEVEK
jgi:hypothetical protein